MSYTRRYGSASVIYANRRHWFRHSLERAKPLGVALWPLFKPRWWAKQKLAGDSRYYGDGGTIHHSGHLDVETYEGKVVAVWFRCQMLPFEQHDVKADRAAQMTRAAEDLPGLTGVEIRDRERI